MCRSTPRFSTSPRANKPSWSFTVKYRYKLALLAAAMLPLLSAQAVYAQEGGGRAKPGPEPKDQAKPAPRLPDGHVDLNGKGVWAPIWVLDWADTKYVDKAIDVPFTPQALKLFQERK